MSDPNQFYRPSNLNFAPPNLAANLMQFGQKPAAKQQASTNQMPAADARKLGENLGAALLRLSRPPQLGQPMPQNVIPQQLQPQQSVAPVNNPGSPFNVTGSLY